MLVHQRADAPGPWQRVPFAPARASVRDQIPGASVGPVPPLPLPRKRGSPSTSRTAGPLAAQMDRRRRTDWIRLREPPRTARPRSRRGGRRTASLGSAADRYLDLVGLDENLVPGLESIRTAAHQTIFRRVDADAVRAGVFDVEHRVPATDHGMAARNLGMRQHPGALAPAPDDAALFAEFLAPDSGLRSLGRGDFEDEDHKAVLSFAVYPRAVPQRNRLSAALMTANLHRNGAAQQPKSRFAADENTRRPDVRKKLEARSFRSSVAGHADPHRQAHPPHNSIATPHNSIATSARRLSGALRCRYT